MFGRMGDLVQIGKAKLVQATSPFLMRHDRSGHLVAR
jgi:hypothetical protein